jgi:hypothetical protein
MNIRSLHHQAMDLAEKAFAADLAGKATVQSLFRKAYQLERQAAELVLAKRGDTEPTRSVLLRSAASLAIECHEYREAERLIAIALSGDPPQEIAEELRDLLERVNFDRHLALRGLELDRSEFQLSLNGEVVSHGFVESSQFLRRAEDTEKLLVRIAERKKQLPFRVSGAPGRGITGEFETYLSVPRAASFAITVRIGRPRDKQQLMLPGFVSPEDVIDDCLWCLERFTSGDRDALRGHFRDEAYFSNFVGLAKRLSPDGERITMVGFTAIRGKEQKQVTMSRPPSDVWHPTSKDAVLEERIIGLFKAADELFGREHVIGVEDMHGNRHKIAVPKGMLHDIVRPLWGERVVLRVQPRKSKVSKLIDIAPADTKETR